MADYYGSAALLDDEEKKKQEQQTQGGALQTGAPQTGGVVTGQAGGGQSGQALNNGGFGGWTNIQSYINANEGNDSSAKLLDSTVGGEFDKEKSRFDSESSKMTNDAKSKADESVGFVNNFQNNLNNAASGNFNNDYANQAKGFLGSNYNPGQFTFSLNQNAQNYGNNLKDDNSFYKMQNDLYAKTSGGPLTTGQQSLQTQLDTSSDKLAQARNSAYDKYLNNFGNLNSSISSVNNQINDYGKQWADNKNKFASDLGNQNAAYQNDYSAYQNQLSDFDRNRKSREQSAFRNAPAAGDDWLSSEMSNIQQEYDQSIANTNNVWNPKNNQWSYIKSILGA